MLFSTTTLLAIVSLATAHRVYVVNVGGNPPSFTPPTLKAKKGEFVAFTFNGAGHTVTESDSASAPCTPKAGGLDSGAGEDGKIYNVTIPAGAVYFHSGPDCAQGAVFILDPPSDDSYAQFKAAATGASSSSSTSGSETSTGTDSTTTTTSVTATTSGSVTYSGPVTISGTETFTASTTSTSVTPTTSGSVTYSGSVTVSGSSTITGTTTSDASASSSTAPGATAPATGAASPVKGSAALVAAILAVACGALVV